MKKLFAVTLYLVILSSAGAQTLAPVSSPCSVFGTASGTCLQGAGPLGSPSSIGTLPAFALGGTISGGGNNLNNIIIGSTTPLAGTFTTAIANTSISSPIHTAPGALTLQSNGSTFAGDITTGQQWYIGTTLNAPASGVQLTVSKNAAAPAVAAVAGTIADFIQVDGTPSRFAIRGFGAGGSGPAVGYFSAGGTAASPTQTLLNDSIGVNFGFGYGTGAYRTGAGSGFQMIALENCSSTTCGSDFEIITTAIGTASQSVVAYFKQGFSVGTTTDPGAGSLQVNATIIAPNLTSDAGLTDTTLCWKNAATAGTFLKGSGTLGICLGTSGAQFKTAFAPMVGGLEEVMQLNLQNYRYRNGYGDSGERMQYGLTAQDVDKVMPDLVRRDASGEAINYDAGAFLFIGLRAIQELKADNDDLRACQATWKCRIFGVK